MKRPSEAWLLRLTGVVTMLPLLQFVAPEPVLQAQRLAVTGDAALLFARHWGLMAAVVGALLVAAAARPPLRRPVLWAALVEKAGLVALIVTGGAALQPLWPAAGFDGACVLLYALCLAQDGRKPSTDR
jgi:choline-glycine betaine transporter